MKLLKNTSICATLIVLTLAVQSVKAQQDETRADGPKDEERFAEVAEVQLTFATVGLYDGRNPGIVKTETRIETRERTENYVIEVVDAQGNRKTELRERQVTYDAEVAFQEMTLLRPGSYTFTTVSGKRFSNNELKHALWDNQPALVVPRDFELDPFFAKMLDPDTIILKIDRPVKPDQPPQKG